MKTVWTDLDTDVIKHDSAANKAYKFEEGTHVQ